MFARLLIANRGEVACRIIRTARKMGIHTIAVYTDAEPHARHVRLADSHYCLGPAPAKSSYLHIPRLIEAAKHTQADAIHPGYGFLSESAAFAEACHHADICFVGPSPDILTRMADKTIAKHHAKQAGIPVIPHLTIHPKTAHDTVIAHIEETLGWPILIKAALGGGGRGIRVVHAPDQFTAALHTAQQEAQANFGQSTVFIEKYLPHARHIEVQILGDTQGHVVHLFERDCSLQRRHQKVIEESPAPHLSKTARTRLYDFACRLGQHIHYVGAGTVEFLVKEEAVYFMEMNTRLQVEHPITEVCTGQDIVQWQLQIAAGHPLPLDQAALYDCHRPIHVIEARLCAEDPQAGFLPASGPIAYFPQPECHLPNLRIDTGFESGDFFPPHYDALIAKIIVHAPTRADAISQLQHRIRTCDFIGPTTNQAFLCTLLSHPEVISGHTHTQYIDQNLVHLLTAPTPAPPQTALPSPPTCARLIATLFAHYHAFHAKAGLQTAPSSPWQYGDAFRVHGQYRYSTQWVDGTALPLTQHQTPRIFLTVHTPQQLILEVGEQHYSCLLTDLSSHHICLRLCGITVRACVYLEWHGGTIHSIKVQYAQTQYTFFLPTPCATGHTPAPPLPETQYALSAPMTGVVTAIPLPSPATCVKKGDRVLQMEAMKLLHTLTAPCDSKIIQLLVKAGDTVQQGQNLIILEPKTKKGTGDHSENGSHHTPTT